VQGPVARTVSDLRLSLRLMIEEEDYGDPRWAPVPFTGAPIAGPVRVALPRNVGTLHADVAQAIDAAAKALVDAGYAVEEVDVPDIEAAAECFGAICVSEMRHLLQGTMRQLGGPQMTRTLDLYLEINKDIGLDGYVKALANRAVFVREWAKFLAKYPLVLMPASTQPPFVVGFDLYDVNVARAALQAIRPLMASSLVGMPSAIVPVGIYNGLPIGVQIVGQKFREDLCLDAAEAIEKQRGVLTPIDPKF
jgi:amidase